MTTDTRVGDWIQTFTGRQFWPCDPWPHEIHLEDIAHSLAMQCRFTGHCREFYSVAEHSVRVSLAVPPVWALWGLLHDASEAYMTDLSRPLKRASALGSEYKKIESRLQLSVCVRFGLTIPEPLIVKHFDNVLLMTEKRDLMAAGISLPKWTEMQEPLAETIVPWDWRTAKQRFIDRFNSIVGTGEAGENRRP